MPVRALDEHRFDAYIGEPAVVVFVRRKDAGCRTLLALLEELALAHEPRVGFARVDIEDCPGLAARFAIDRVPTVLVFDDYRGGGRLPPPITRAELTHLIATGLPGGTPPRGA